MENAPATPSLPRRARPARRLASALSPDRPDAGSSYPGGMAGKVELSYRLDGPLPGSVCVPAGTELVITLEETRGYAWTAVESLHPKVVRVLRSGRGPKVTAVARAAAAGEAELRWTSSFTGDPHGPPTLLWRLTVTVVS